MAEKGNTIWTIGHSNRTKEEFLEALLSFGIEGLVDVRRFPGSRKHPQFSAEALQEYLPQAGITYYPCLELGGRRKPVEGSTNTVWKSKSFQAYADYSQTPDFQRAIHQLTDLATEKRVAYMCSEAVWWRCHRAIISDYLKERNWQVMHIMEAGVAKEHPFTTVYRETHQT
ncbi:DUF488 domain-containing protein [Adhaeribacter soli]|uniref:DUF488 domain-containing protein n=1 Tax=Adhaeribacter soli TaxID=2607655 RepID=A0A5N1IT20_9BACT|nr:DUF488 domain-containing protein [Adhaeribacter soli]KAA9332808.1 DUF488 domain-containing protein [Adhaeribacter soli]